MSNLSFRAARGFSLTRITKHAIVLSHFSKPQTAHE